MGVLKVMQPLTESRTGAVKHSPSGMLYSPQQGMAGMPWIEKERSVPGAEDPDPVGLLHQLLQAAGHCAAWRIIDAGHIQDKIEVICQRTCRRAGPGPASGIRRAPSGDD